MSNTKNISHRDWINNILGIFEGFQLSAQSNTQRSILEEMIVQTLDSVQKQSVSEKQMKLVQAILQWYQVQKGDAIQQLMTKDYMLQKDKEAQGEMQEPKPEYENVQAFDIADEPDLFKNQMEFESNDRIATNTQNKGLQNLGINAKNDMNKNANTNTQNSLQDLAMNATNEKVFTQPNNINDSDKKLKSNKKLKVNKKKSKNLDPNKNIETIENEHTTKVSILKENKDKTLNCESIHKATNSKLIDEDSKNQISSNCNNSNESEQQNLQNLNMASNQNKNNFSNDKNFPDQQENFNYNIKNSDNNSLFQNFNSTNKSLDKIIENLGKDQKSNEKINNFNNNLIETNVSTIKTDDKKEEENNLFKEVEDYSMKEKESRTNCKEQNIFIDNNTSTNNSKICVSCSKKALYNQKGNSAKYCDDHKTNNMVLTSLQKCNKNFKCKDCDDTALQNYEEQLYPIYCEIHKQLDMKIIQAAQKDILSKKKRKSNENKDKNSSSIYKNIKSSIYKAIAKIMNLQRKKKNMYPII